MFGLRNANFGMRIERHVYAFLNPQSAIGQFLPLRKFLLLESQRDAPAEDSWEADVRAAEDGFKIVEK